MFSVVFGLATNSSNGEILNWLKEISNEMSLIDPNRFKVQVVICINGRQEKAPVSLDSDLDIMILNSDNPGKNDALNLILQYSRNHEYDIIHFFDDDIMFKKGSIRKNLETLINYPVGSPILVGSDFKVNEANLNLLQKVLNAPFEHDSDSNLFLSGTSICSWTSVYPKMPDSKDLIAEDSFVCIYFIKNYQGAKIIKPVESITYFDSVRGLKDWYWQQVRVYVGVEKSFCMYPNDYERLQNFFSWRYAENPKYRLKRKTLSVNAFIKLSVFRFLQKFVFIKGNKLLKRDSNIMWNKNRGEE